MYIKSLFTIAASLAFCALLTGCGSDSIEGCWQKETTTINVKAKKPEVVDKEVEKLLEDLRADDARNSEVFCFAKDGTFEISRQGEVIDRGEYTVNGGTLKLTDGRKTEERKITIGSKTFKLHDDNIRVYLELALAVDLDDAGVTDASLTQEFRRID